MSELAKKVAGTFVPDESGNLPATLAWVTEECRSGRFHEQLRKFCEAQPELLDSKLALVEQVTPECLQGRVPCRCFDHEAASTFVTEVRFELNLRTHQAQRLN